MTQSAVSWKIKRLEERVGQPLLIRDGHSLRPSRAGRALLDDARTLVEIHDRAAARLQSSELSGMVKLGSCEEVDAARLASLLGKFRRSHTSASIEFVIDHSEHLMHAIDEGGLDVAIIQVDDAGLRPTDTILWTDQLRWVTSCEIVGNTEDVVPLITFGEHCFYRRLSEPDLVAAGIDFNVAFSASSISGVRAAIAAGLGVGVLGSRYLGGDIVPWHVEQQLPPLPIVHQVARTVPGEAAAVATALVDVIASELLDPAPLEHAV